MEISQVKALIEQGLPGCRVEVEGDGSHFQARVISEAFSGLNRVKRQQLVYSTVQSQIADGSLHALSFKTFTPDEWAVETQ